jgi:hypothetical protein
LTATNQNCTNEGQTVVVKIVEEFIPCMTCMCKVKEEPWPARLKIFCLLAQLLLIEIWVVPFFWPLGGGCGGGGVREH